MKAILIRPAQKAVTEVEYSGDYRTIAKLIEADSGLFTAVGIDEDNFAYVDDEGLLVNPNPHGYFAFRGYHGVLAGNALVLGLDNGGDVEPTLTVEQVAEIVRFIDNPPPEQIEPRAEVMTLEEADARGLLPPSMRGLL
jgi:hypothetical protein